MRKQPGIGLLIAFLLCIGNPLNTMAAKQLKTPKIKVEALTGSRKVVRNYYAAYIDYQQYDLKKTDKKVKPVPDRTLDPGFVTPHFIDSYKKLMVESDRLTPQGEAGPLDYDPIICAQDFPDSMAGSSVDLVHNTRTAATVKVHMGGFTPVAPPFIVELKKLKQGWRIDSVLCDGKDFGSLYKNLKRDGSKQKK